jgi:hypothetical protein
LTQVVLAGKQGRLRFEQLDAKYGLNAKAGVRNQKKIFASRKGTLNFPAFGYRGRFPKSTISEKNFRR